MSLRKIKQQFHSIARFPNVVGAIDGTLIPIKGMGGDDEPIYVSRKNFHALNTQGVVDAEMRFVHTLYKRICTMQSIYKCNSYEEQCISQFYTIKRCCTHVSDFLTSIADSQAVRMMHT